MPCRRPTKKWCSSCLSEASADIEPFLCPRQHAREGARTPPNPERAKFLARASEWNVVQEKPRRGVAKKAESITQDRYPQVGRLRQEQLKEQKRAHKKKRKIVGSSNSYQGCSVWGGGNFSLAKEPSRVCAGKHSASGCGLAIVGEGDSGIVGGTEGRHRPEAGPLMIRNVLVMGRSGLVLFSREFANSVQQVCFFPSLPSLFVRMLQTKLHIGVLRPDRARRSSCFDVGGCWSCLVPS